MEDWLLARGGDLVRVAVQVAVQVVVVAVGRAVRRLWRRAGGAMGGTAMCVWMMGGTGWRRGDRCWARQRALLARCCVGMMVVVRVVVVWMGRMVSTCVTAGTLVWMVVVVSGRRVKWMDRSE